MHDWTLLSINNELLDNPYKDKRCTKIIKKRNSMLTANPKLSSIHKTINNIERYKSHSNSFSKTEDNTIKPKHYYIHIVDKKSEEKQKDFSACLSKIMKLHNYYKVFSKSYLLRNPVEKGVAEQLVKEYFPYYSNNKAKILANLFFTEEFQQSTTSNSMEI
jgi:hypothetical protein